MAEYLLKSVAEDTVGEFFIQGGGNYTVLIWGDNFGGGSVDLIQTADQQSIIPVSDRLGNSISGVTLNSAYRVEESGQGISLRASLSGSTGPVNVNVAIFQ